MMRSDDERAVGVPRRGDREREEGRDIETERERRGREKERRKERGREKKNKVSRSSERAVASGAGVSHRLLISRTGLNVNLDGFARRDRRGGGRTEA